MNRITFINRLVASFFSIFIPRINRTILNKKKYFLTKFYIAGFVYYQGETVINSLKIGDELIIIQEPSNPYDRRALEIFTANNIKLGYVPKQENPIPSRLMRQKVNIVGVVDKINLDADAWRMLRVSLYAEV